MPAPAPPAAVLDQWALYDQVGFDPHAGQRQVLSSDARFTSAVCGRRFGKSELGGHRLLTEAFYTYPLRDRLKRARKRREFWVVGPEYSDSEKEFRVLHNQLRRLEVPFDRPGTYNNPATGDMRVSLWGGTFVVAAKSASHPESLVGEGLSGVLLAEAAKIRERVWLKSLRPTLNDFKGWALFTSTPEGKNWLYKVHQLGQDPRYVNYRSYRMPSWLNPHVYPGGAAAAGLAEVRRRVAANDPVTEGEAAALGVDPEVAALAVDLTPAAFDQEVGAEFTDFVGRVFPDFSDDTYDDAADVYGHVGDLAYEPGWATYGAVDYGSTNPNVWLLLQVDPHGELVNVLGEVYERGLGPDQFAERIRERGLAPAGLRAFYPDPASPGDTSVLERTLHVPGMPHTGGPTRDRLDLIRRWLRPSIRGVRSRPALMFDRSCVETIRDFNDYRYPDVRTETDRNAPENPMKVNDHAPEALGRFFAGHFGTAAVEGAATRYRTAKITRRR